jgi:bacterial/archaeal transporter family protein
MWKWYAILSAIFAALTAILAKIGVKNVNSNVATAIRTIVILVMSWGIVWIAGEVKHVKGLSRHNLLFLGLSGIATGLSWLFYFKALQEGPVSKVAPIDKFSVALAIGLSFIVLHETPDLKTIIGGILIVAGTIVMVV